MKILFVNAPVIRSEYSSAENDFKIDGFIFKLPCRKIPGLIRLLRFWGMGKGIRYGVRAGSRWPWTRDTPISALHYPFIMAYAASLLKKNGFEVDIIDAVADEEYSYEKFFEKVKGKKADIVVIECSTPTIDIDLWVAKRMSNFTKVCLAGPHLINNAENIMDENAYITYLLKGEYIKSSLEMARTLRSGIYESEVVDDIDSIPFPYRDFSAATKYYDPTMPTPRPQLQIYASKGCPFKCTFCMWPQTMYQGKVAYRKPECVAEEIRFCVDKYGYKSIFFDDDTFNVGNKRVSKLCVELKEIGLPWTMMGRLDCSPFWLYDKMVDSGCVGMRFGIETFDIQVLKNIKKGLESEELIETLAHITKKHPHLMIHLTMMKDLPGQTEEIHQKDMKILKDFGYGKDNIYRSYQLASCVPFPGTEMYRQLIEEIGEDKLKDHKLYDGGQDTIMKKI
ncbi:MAG: Radical SAM superfamily protein [Candidatus Argoarchaeum ethanivorans]|uniref:Radical SAM superfamily protein n=1 Tax=Candidatus Argoarchaeum ethanivorans TaxID=2608793 RepID=A0A811T2R9_9EURY|nr:MAG: Radical SAM superfamily protein [Candidatus Argoarchaeum ethanivorans]